MEIPKTLKDEIWEYCKLNDIPNIDNFNLKMLRQGFTVEKYGATPSERIVEKVVDKIVEVEKIVEKPVEIIREVEKIVEKNVYVTNDEETKKLTDKIIKLEGDVETLANAEKTQVKIVFEVSRERNALKKEVERLTNELEAERLKPKQEEKKDIYGENKKGFFGSNTSDIYGKE